VSLVVGSTGWLVVRRGTARATADDAPPVVTVRAERRSLRDVVVVRGALRGRSLPSLVAVGGGRVTAVRARAGAVVEAGDVLFDVEAQPVVAVAGQFPYWRTLDRGVRGADVTQLEQLLQAEGLSPGPVDDRFDWRTRAAVKGWQERHGLPVDGVFRADRVVVAPWPVRINRVGVAVGRSVGPEQELFAIATRQLVGAFRVSAADRSRLARGQAVTVTPARGGDAVQGKITEVAAAPDAPDTEGGSPSYAVVVDLGRDPSLPDGAALRGDVVVASAEDVVTVPVAAVRSAADGSPAVQVDRDGRHRVVAVELGLQEGGYVEVRSGLQAGARVVLRLR
jgi:peptidoglycan hydrolase-like protein with peptidoglycan-binding domain